MVAFGLKPTGFNREYKKILMDCHYHYDNVFLHTNVVVFIRVDFDRSAEICFWLE